MENQGGARTGAVSSTVLVRAIDDETARGRSLATIAGDDPGEREVFVVTRDDAPGTIVDEWHDHVGATPATFGIVAVGAMMRSASTRSAGETPQQHNVVRGVDTVADASGVIADWATASRPTTVYVDPSTIADDRDRGRLVTFVDDLAEVLDGEGDEIWYGVDPDRTDRPIVALLTTLVDDVRDVAGTDETASEPPVTNQSGIADESTDTVAAAPAISQSDVLALLANDRRRMVLHWLRRTDQSLSVTELAERLVECERPQARSGTDGSFERIYADLYHAQLHKLADAGVITFDTDERTAWATPRLAALEPHLTLTAATDIGD